MKVQFSSKYSKSYATMEAAERAIIKYQGEGEAIRWIPTIDEEEGGRIIPVILNKLDAIHRGFAVCN